jgi:hypothetical protein
MAKPKRVSNRNGAAEAIVAREPFQGNNFSGGPTGVTLFSGRLNDENAAKMYAEKPNYVVKSYGTPIAWHGDNGWTVPDQKHSVTTSNHQGIVRRALGLNDHFKSGQGLARL